jgi:hypothetical protein
MSEPQKRPYASPFTHIHSAAAMQQAQILGRRHRADARRLEPVLARWGREFYTFVNYPVTFRWGLDRVPFMIASSLVLFYAMLPGMGRDADALLGYLKYLFAALQLSWFAVLAMIRQRINLSPAFPLAALLLCVAGGISFTYSIVVAPGTSTYASALIPLIIVATPLLIPSDATQTDGTAVAKYLFRIFGLASLFHILWQTTDRALGLEEYYSGHHEIGVLLVNFMILCALFRRNRLLVLSIALIGLNLLLRPSSTIAFSAIFAIAFIVFHRLPYQRLLRTTSVLAAGIILAANFAILMNKDVAEALYSIEPWMKEDALGAISDNLFRLGVIHAAHDEIFKESLLVGKFFSGDINVNANDYIPYVNGYYMSAGSEPIHSDYILMLQQGGLIGYALFASFFVGVARLCARAARLAHAAGDDTSETLFDALQAIYINFMLCISANPVLGIGELSLPFFMLVPLTVFLARAQPGFVGSWRQRAGALTRNRHPVPPARGRG